MQPWDDKEPKPLHNSLFDNLCITVTAHMHEFDIGDRQQMYTFESGDNVLRWASFVLMTTCHEMDYIIIFLLVQS